jgi:hypothetical protein
MNIVRKILSYLLPLKKVGGVVSINKADTSTDGYLSKEDWNEFNNKTEQVDLTADNISTSQSGTSVQDALDAIEAGDVDSVNGQTGTVVLNAEDINTDTTGETVQTHIDDTDNPHSVTKTQVGLSDVDNKSEATIITDVKADADVASAISLKHASGSDNQTADTVETEDSGISVQDALNTLESDKVDKVAGSSLVSDTEISKIHASGSDNQDASEVDTDQSGMTVQDWLDSLQGISHTHANKTDLDLLSGTNTGDNATNSQYSGVVTNATHTGDVTGAIATVLTAWETGNLTYVPISGDLATYIAAATAGDTLFLAAGTYTITSGITLNKKLHIKGLGIGITTIATSSNILLFNLSGSGCLISNLTISHAGQSSASFIANLAAASSWLNIQFLHTGTIGGSVSTGCFAIGAAVTTNIYNCSYVASGAIDTHHFIDGAVSGATINIFNSDIRGSNGANATIGNCMIYLRTADTCNIYNSYISDSSDKTGGVIETITNAGAIINCYNCTLNGSGATGFDVKQTSGTINIYSSVLVNNKTSGTITFLGTLRSGNLSGVNTGDQTADTVSTDDSGISVQESLDSKTTLSEVKLDSDIADAISKKHSNILDHASGSDNQDASEVDTDQSGVTVQDSLDSKYDNNTANQYTQIASKATLADADITIFEDSESNPQYIKRSVVWSSIKSTLKTYFDSIYSIFTQASDIPTDQSGQTVQDELDVLNSVYHANTLDHTQGTDQGLDTGGLNATTAAEVKSAVDLKHASGSDDQIASTVPTDDSGVSVQDWLDSLQGLSHSNSLDHTQNTDTILDDGGVNEVSAAEAKAGYTHSQIITGNPHNTVADDIETDQSGESVQEWLNALQGLSHTHSNKTDLDLLSGTNTGDNAVNSNYSSLVSNSSHTGDVTGSTATKLIEWADGNVTYVPLTGDIATYIANATAGDTLILASGTYTVTAAIAVNKKLHIMGQGPGATTIACSTDLGNTQVINITGAGSIISDLAISFSGAQTGAPGNIIYTSVACDIYNISISNTATGAATVAHYGINNGGSGIINIHNCDHVATGDIGFHGFFGSTGSGTTNIRNCKTVTANSDYVIYGINEIQVSGGTVNIYDSHIESSSATTGGLIHLLSGTVNIYNSTLNASNAVAYEVLNAGGTVYLSGCTLVTNKISGIIDFGTKDAWVSWAPTLGWGGGSPTIDATKTAYRYKIDNGKCFIHLCITASDGNAATSLTIPLPIAVKDTNSYVALVSQEIVDGVYSMPYAYLDALTPGTNILFGSLSALTDNKICYILVEGFYEI